MDELQTALKEAERVSKKQRTCASTTVECIDALLEKLKVARSKLTTVNHSISAEQARDLVSDVIADIDAHTKVSAAIKDLHSSVSKLGKVMEKAFISDVCKAYRDDLRFNQEILNKVIAQHLFREGRFEIGEELCNNAYITERDKIMEPFITMHEILQAIAARDLEPALQWIEQNRGRLSANMNKTRNFEFQLHQLQYVNLLEIEGAVSALSYAKIHFSKFASSHMAKIQRLMGCLLFAGRLYSSPYSDLLTDKMWGTVSQEFVRQCCGLLGQAADSPLLVTLSAGAASLPQLLKLFHLLKEKGQDLAVCQELPVELELGQEFVFHSIFACPVSRDQSTPDNPPTMLPCGHVLCKQSVIKIAKGTTRTFKCPYCPMEAQQSNCRQITFPDALV